LLQFLLYHSTTSTKRIKRYAFEVSVALGQGLALDNWKAKGKRRKVKGKLIKTMSAGSSFVIDYFLGVFPLGNYLERELSFHSEFQHLVSILKIFKKV